MYQIKEINEYFKKFVIEHRYSIRYCSYDTIEEKSIEKIIKRKNTSFHKSWDDLIILMLIIEEVYEIQKITMSKNWCCFEFPNEKREQDKGFTKREALYNCCLRILIENWKAKAPNVEWLSEPFDSIDLK